MDCFLQAMFVSAVVKLRLALFCNYFDYWHFQSTNNGYCSITGAWSRQKLSWLLRSVSTVVSFSLICLQV